MKITLLFIGKTDEEYLRTGCAVYFNRIKRYLPLEEIIIPSVKNIRSAEDTKEQEAGLILKKIKPDDRLILLDERGTQHDSVGLSKFLAQNMNSGIKNLVLLVGGPYGFSEKIYKRANGTISLSELTFPHQLVRLFLMEQLYRAFTILRNEPYHHV